MVYRYEKFDIRALTTEIVKYSFVICVNDQLLDFECSQRLVQIRTIQFHVIVNNNKKSKLCKRPTNPIKIVFERRQNVQKTTKKKIFLAVLLCLDYTYNYIYIYNIVYSELGYEIKIYRCIFRVPYFQGTLIREMGRQCIGQKDSKSRIEL